MATTTQQVQTPLERYLHTTYRPDCDWIEGELRERSLGQFDHANLQKILINYLSANEKAWNVRVLPEQRVKVAAARYRVPDLIIISRQDRDSIITKPPLVCIEILSPDDTVSDHQDRIIDYLGMGVENIWVFDPMKERTWLVDRQGSWITVQSEDALTCGPINVKPAEIFRLAAE